MQCVAQNPVTRDRTMNNSQTINSRRLDRRQMLARSAALATLGGVAWQGLACADEKSPIVTKGNIRQSIVQWCFNKYWNVEKTCQIVQQLGIPSVELVAPEHWPTLKKYGLTCAIASSHSF